MYVESDTLTNAYAIRQYTASKLFLVHLDLVDALRQAQVTRSIFRKKLYCEFRSRCVIINIPFHTLITRHHEGCHRTDHRQYKAGSHPTSYPMLP